MSKVNGLVFLLPSMPNQPLSYQHELAIKLEVTKLLPHASRLYILPLSSYGVPLYEDTVRVYIGSNTLSELDSQQREIFMQDTTLRILYVGNEAFSHPGHYYAIDNLNPDRLKTYLTYLIESVQNDLPLQPIKKHYYVGISDSISMDIYLTFTNNVNKEKVRTINLPKNIVSPDLGQPIVVTYLTDAHDYVYDPLDLVVLSEPNTIVKNVRDRSLINIDSKRLTPEYLEHIIMAMYELTTYPQ